MPSGSSETKAKYMRLKIFLVFPDLEEICLPSINNRTIIIIEIIIIGIININYKPNNSPALATSASFRLVQP